MDSSNATRPMLGFQILRCLALRVWAGNPRRTVDPAGLAELAGSVATVGVLEPLLVRPLATADGEITHEILAGQRRFLAAGIAGLVDLPVIVRAVPDDVALELALAENAGREDVHPLEEAEAIDALVKAHGRTAEQVADRLGRPVRWVQRRLTLLSLCPAARALLVTGTLPLAHAQALAAVDADTQARVLTQFPIERGFPTAKAFARAIIYELHLLSGAPFDAGDEKLPGGACGTCRKRSDAQIDLFCGGPSDGVHCLDAACWDGKVVAIWERAQKAAKKKHLQVLNGDDVFRGGFGPTPQVRADAPYTLKAPAADAQPVAIARTSRGKVVELYAALAVRGGDDEAEGETEDERHEKARARDDAHRATVEARRAEALKVAEAKTARLVEVAGTPVGLALALRVGLAGMADLDGDRGEGLFRVCTAMGLAAPSVLGIEGVLRTVSAEDLPPLAAAYLASVWALNPDADEQDPTARELRALLDAPPPSEASPPAVRLWVSEGLWDALPNDARDDLEEPIGGAAVAWSGREGWITAEVSDVAVLTALRGMAEALDLPMYEGAAPPVFDPERPAAHRTIELRAKRGDWLQHRSGLRDTAKAPLHKRWLPDDQDRVAKVSLGEVYSKILAYCREHGVTLLADGVQVSPEKPVEAPAKPARKPAKGKKGGAA